MHRLLPLVLVAVACAAQPPVAAPATPTTAGTTAPTETTTTAPRARSTTTTLPPAPTTTLPPLQRLAYEVVAEGLVQPVLAVTAPGDERLHVVTRPGLVHVLEGDGSLRVEPFLDLRERVADNGIEQGLLGLAFHPAYPENGRVFAYYVGEDDDSRLVELAADPEAALGDPASERVILSFDQAIQRHYGGMLRFGPEGELYVSLGEGGAASVHSQDPATLLSAILRLDVDTAKPYAIPPGNPFASREGGAPEVWAYGLRNPWRFDIDPVERLLVVADVGHEDWEEIDVVPLDTADAPNFGWLRMEGTHCFQRGCDPEGEGLTLPLFEYSHDEGCSITGGFVYRGVAIPELAGEYLFSDWCEGWLRSLRPSDGRVTDWTEQVGVIGQVNGFGVDHGGEVYVLTWEGSVVRIVPVR